MAEEKDEKSAEEQSGEQDVASSGGPGPLVWGVISILAIGSGFATPYLAAGLGSESPEVQAEESDKIPDLPEPSGEVEFIVFDETVVNLDEGSMTRYLRIKPILQVDKQQFEAINKLVEVKKVILKNWLLSYLGDKGMDDIRGAAGQNRLRREIKDHFNSVLFEDGYDRIHDILFEDFNVQ